jgi:subtilisin family serine protease
MRSFAARLLALTVFLAFPASIPAAAGSAGDSLKVWVNLRDKGVPPEAFRDARAYEDAPVHAPYLDALEAAGFRVSVALKWQNKVSGWTDSAGAEALRRLPFVLSVEGLPRKAASASTPPGSSLSDALAKRSGAFGNFDSVFIKSGAGALRDTLAARALRPGEGLRIAVMDEDFHLGHQAFDSLFANGRIADQWDFVQDSSVAADRGLLYSHGAMVLSPLAAQAPDLAVGLAPHARYLLYRTENEASETYAEEDFLAAAFERAVDSGAQVINVSLGYRYDFDASMPVVNLPLSAMDGRTRPASIAAVGAARRGALVVVAMGNEAAFQPSPSVTSPADADSILSIGMVDPKKLDNSVRGWCSYSSTGNTADGRLKPEISAASVACGVPVADAGTRTGMRTETGTSLGAPVIAGIGALLRQLHPGKNAQEIRAALMVTGSRSNAPDARVGNGLVRAAQAHCALLLDTLTQSPCPTSRTFNGMVVWRGGNVIALPGITGVNLARPRLWDLQGRPQPVETFRDEDGTIQLRSRKRIAPGPYILRIPRAPGDSLSN